MDTFADKVRYGTGIRFDPMMEEKGGWIAGEGQRQDVEMSDAVIEILAKARHHTEGEDPNPFKGFHGEVLPPNLERSFSGFLVRKDVIKFKVNTEKLLAHIAELKNQLLICKFVGPKPPPPHAMKLWIQALNEELQGSTLTFCRNVGKGYFILSGDDEDALSNALMLTPFRSKWGTCMIQSWVPGFNLANPSNLAFPTWVSLRNMPFEHQDQALAIAESLGEVIGMDTANDNAKDPRFCVNLEISKGWVTCIDLECEGGVLAPQKIMVDYDKLPIRCRVCLSWNHKASDCKEGMRRPMRMQEKYRSMYPHSYQQNEKGKNPVVDEEGFQQVKQKKSTWRKIFEQNPLDGRANTGDPRRANADQPITDATTVAAKTNQHRSNDRRLDPGAIRTAGGGTDGRQKLPRTGEVGTGEGVDGGKFRTLLSEVQDASVGGDLRPTEDRGHLRPAATPKDHQHHKAVNGQPNSKDQEMLDNKQSMNLTEIPSRNKTQKDCELPQKAKGARRCNGHRLSWLAVSGPWKNHASLRTPLLSRRKIGKRAR